MCLFTHFAAGALAGGVTGNVWIAAVAGAASHAVLDAIPHYDHPDWRVELAGGLLGLVLLLAMPFASWAAVVGGVFGMLPDLENLFQKLGRLRRERFIFPSHTGLIPHGRTLGPRSLVWQAAIFVGCFVLLGMLAPGQASAAPYSENVPVMAAPTVEVVSSGADRTVLRIEQTLKSFGGDWSDVDARRIVWGMPPAIEGTGDERVIVAPRLNVTVAVPTRRPVRTTVLASSWWKEPGRTVAQAELVSFGEPGVYRSVPLSSARVPLGVGDGVLRSITVAVEHPATREYSDLIAAAKSAAGAAWREGRPAGLVNPVVYDEIGRGARAAALDRSASKSVQAEVPDLFSLTGHWARLRVTETGVYSFSGQDLLLAGVSNTSVHPASLRLYRGGGLSLVADPSVPDSLQIDSVGLNEVAIRVSGAEDGEWNLDDEIRFYGVGTSTWLDRFDPEALPLEHFDHPFAAEAVYWLTWESGPDSPLPGTARRVTDQSALPSAGSVTDRGRLRLHFERQGFSEVGRVADNWVWYNSISSSASEQFELPAAITDSTARFVIDWRGNTDDDSDREDEISAAAWANDDQSTRVETAFQVAAPLIGEIQPNQEDSLRVRLGGPFLPVADQANRITLQNTATWTGHRDLSLDSYDIMYWARLDLNEWSGQLSFAHWRDLVPAPGTAVDLAVLPPTGGSVNLWDVTDPDSPRSLLGGDSAQSPDADVFGVVADPDTDLHFVAVTQDRLLNPATIRLVNPTSLRQESVDVDYIVIHPADFTQPARTLADFRSSVLPDTDTPVAIAVDVQDIYDNFSGGRKDWRAIRNYLRFVYQEGGHRLRYVCLLGNACRDYRNYLERTPGVDLFYDWVPADIRTPFPDNPFVDLTKSPYASDDGLVSFDAAGYQDVDFPELAVGRLPAVDVGEAEMMVQRCISYEAETDPGAWRNSITMVTDDTHKIGIDPYRGEQAHTIEAEYVCNYLVPTSLDVGKIYGVAYEFPPGGTNKPEMRADINTALSAGTTMYHYIGHGSQDSLADERIFESSDIGGLTNGMMRAVFVAFSCDVGVYDSNSRRSMAEQFLVSSGGGAIGSICASQVTYGSYNNMLTNAFYENLFPGRHVDRGRSVGQALQWGKVAMYSFGSRRNSQRYNLMGDPAGRLPHPVDDLGFAAASFDTLQAGVLHSAVLETGGAKRAISAGDTYDLRVQESAHLEYYPFYVYSVPDTTLPYVKSGSPVFQGNGTVGMGGLQVPFMAPAQFQYGQSGRVRLIVSGDDGDHVAEMQVPAVRNTEGTGDDSIGPVIRLAFADGLTRVRPGAALSASLTDPSGIAMLGTSPGNSILMEFDDTGFMTDITESFRYDPDSYTSGSIDMALPADMDLGAHVVALHASDAMGNVGSDTLSFRIEDSLVGGMDSVALFPNPTSGPCRLVFESGEAMDLRWDIYTLDGLRIRSLASTVAASGPASIYWDGRDERGDEIANGTYIYVLRGRAASDPERPLTRTGKLVLMK